LVEHVLVGDDHGPVAHRDFFDEGLVEVVGVLVADENQVDVLQVGVAGRRRQHAPGGPCNPVPFPRRGQSGCFSAQAQLEERVPQIMNFDRHRKP